MEESTGLFVNKSKLRQEFSVKLFRCVHVFHSQIDMIKATRFHVRASTAWRGTSNICDRNKVGRVTPCAPPFGNSNRLAEDREPYSIRRRSAPKSVPIFLSSLLATTSGRSPAQYPTRNVPTRLAHWGFVE